MEHSNTKKRPIGYAFCGSFCTLQKSIDVLATLTARYDVTPIFSEKMAATDTRFGTADDFTRQIEHLCSHPAIRTVSEAERIGPEKRFEALVIAPCTGNTLAKLACGVTDGAVTMAAKAHLRNARPLLLALASNDALAAGLGNLGAVILRKNIFLVPLGQDDPFAKPTSLVADFNRIPEALEEALQNRQIQPLLLARDAPKR